MGKHLNPNTINDLSQAKVIITELINALETFTKDSREQKQIIQELRDEISRLKGEKGKPKIKPDKENENDLSSDKEREEKKSWKKTE